jgi:hypothetical protein
MLAMSASGMSHTRMLRMRYTSSDVSKGAHFTPFKKKNAMKSAVRVVKCAAVLFQEYYTIRLNPTSGRV